MLGNNFKITRRKEWKN